MYIYMYKYCSLCNVFVSFRHVLIYEELKHIHTLSQIHINSIFYFALYLLGIFSCAIFIFIDLSSTLWPSYCWLFNTFLLHRLFSTYSIRDWSSGDRSLNKSEATPLLTDWVLKRYQPSSYLLGTVLSTVPSTSLDRIKFYK